ncbi:MAG: ATP-binding protein [Candidatus Methanoperedens sp.]|nr:ATP-binding protein [Candidatus Methanoperedens sp.]
MITKIKIVNFKSIKRLEIKLAPLTIFVGPNGSGKTSILQAIALMSQAATKNFSLINARKGEMVDFEDVNSLFHNKKIRDWLSLGFEIQLNKSDLMNIKDGASKDLENTKEQISRYFIDFLNDLNDLDEKNMNTVRYVNKIKTSDDGQNYDFKHTYFINKMKTGCKSEINRVISFPVDENLSNWSPNFLSIPHWNLSPKPFIDSEFYKILYYILRKRIGSVYFLSPERGGIPWYYATKEKHDYVGRTGEYTLEILSELMKAENDEKRLPYELLSKEFGIENIWSGWERENILTSSYNDPWLKSGHKFPSLGHGSKQLLPVLAQLAYSKPGSIILVDEPEISLHPEYQAKLPILFGNAVHEGKQILVTSHSSYFPLSIQQIFEGIKLVGQTTRGSSAIKFKLDVKDVMIYQVVRGKDGGTEVKLLELNKNGLKEAIPSFADVERGLLERFMKTEEVEDQI